jgi:apolipoprotein N-acyltransferase
MIYLISFILGLICSFGQPPLNYSLAALLSFALFFHLLLNLEKRISLFLFSFSFGYGYCIYSIHWFSESLLTYGDSLLWLVPFSLLLMPAIFALYFALAGYLIKKLSNGNILIIAFIWLFIELIRSYVYIEFPWLLAGYIWSDSHIISQNSSIFGIWGLSFLTIIWAGAIMQAFNSDRASKFPIIFIAFISFILCHFYGIQHLSSPIKNQQISVKIIQSNIDQNIDSRMKNSYSNLLKLIDLSKNSDDIDYVIWPEGANEYQLDYNLINLIKYAAPKYGSLIFSSSRLENNPEKHWNSMFILNRDGVITDYYDKIHLVPLGEYIPFKLRTIFPFINKITPGGIDYSPGEGLKIINKKHPFLPNICYEAAFPIYSHNKFTWIVNLTNDGWFGKSFGPHQHLAMVRIRSIEQGVPMIRAALTGISAIIDSFGNIVDSIPLLKAGVIQTNIPGYIDGFTYYNIYGNYMLMLLMLAILVIEKVIKKLFNNFQFH